jgi:FG-GAP-like repeat
MTTFNVNQTTDNGKGDTAGTLSYAILQANNQAGDDQIVLDNDVRLTGAMQQLISSNISIVGNNHKLSGDVNNNATVDAGDVRPLFVFSGTVGISDLTITNGLAQGSKGGGAGMGGGLFVYDGDVSLNNVTLNNNKAIGGGTTGSENGVVGIVSIAGTDVLGSNGTNNLNGGNGGDGRGSDGGFGGDGGKGTGGNGADDLNGSGGIGGRGTGGNGGFGGDGGQGDSGAGGNGRAGTTGSDGTAYGGNGGFGGSGGFANSKRTIFGSGGKGGFGGASGSFFSSTLGFIDGTQDYAGFGAIAGAGAGFGGAIFVRGGSLNLTNTTLTNNSAIGGTNDQGTKAQGLGGAVFVMNTTTNINGNNQGMPTTLPTVRSLNATTYTGNNAADDPATNNIYGSVKIAPTITRARYDINSGNLVVTGTDFLALTGTNNDINPSKLTITGEGGTSYTLTSANVDLTNSTSFTVALNASDKTALKSIITKKGTQSNSNNTYNLAAAEDWNAGAAPFFDADLTNNGLTAVADPIFNPNPFGITNVGANSTPTFGDIDGNGTLDAFMGNQSGNTLFFKNTGTTTAPAFAPAVANPFGLTSGVVFYAPTLVDIDGNGTLDIFVGGLLGNTQFFKNTGTNTAPAFAPAVSNPFGLSSVGGESAPTFADIDGDGKLDAMMGNTAGDTIFFKNTGTTTAPAFAPAVTNPFGLTSVGNDSKPTFTDVDGDGTLDAVIGNRTGDTLFFRNIGTKTVPAFAPAVTNPFGVTNVGSDSAPAIVDINGDGTLETFVGNSAGNTLFFSNLQPPATTPTRNDFNGDGKSDILWRSTDGSVITWQMNGATVTSENSLLTATPGSLTTANPDWKIAGTGDFNGDRKSDLLRQNSTTGNVETWQINGSTVVAKTAIGNATGWQAAGTGDFNGDGKSDILWRNDGVVALWQMDGATVTASTVGTPSNDWKVASTGDFDGDGKADILWQKDAGDLALWQMDGAAVVKATSFAVVPTGWKIAGSGDFNGDSKSDLVLRNQNGDVAAWQMNGAKVTATAVVGNAPTDWQIAEAGNDLNGDGKADLLWRSATGGVASWQMDGFKVLTAGATSIPTAATAWNIVAPLL